MNSIDILLIIPLVYAAWKGFKHGLIIEVFTLLALFVGIYVGIHFSDFMSLYSVLCILSAL
jgi:membrane protein required for colicin V production